MESNAKIESKTGWFNRPLSAYLPRFTLYHLLVVLVLITAVVSRFYDLGLRVMSHDEVNHVVPAFELYQGRGYAHDPVTHGPLQFHLLAGSYFLFSDSDFSARIPAALFSIATVAFVIFGFRRYLGRNGALIAGLLFVVSPFMLFYGRYTRNEAFVGLFGVLMLYAVLRYLEAGKSGALYLFTAVLALHFTTKETSFIYSAQLLIFLAVLFLRDVVKHEWPNAGKRDVFIFATMSALLFIGVALGAAVLNAGQATAEAAAPAAESPIYHWVMLISLALAAVGLVLAAFILIHSMGWRLVKNIRSFDLLILTVTLILPQLIAFPIKIAGWNPLDYSQPGLIRTSIFLLAAVVVSAALGLLWKPRLWLINLGIFYAIFTVFYTTFFTNGQGFFTGLVGSLGYWLSQQGVNRGSQPWYYFAFLQLPMYEFLAVLGSLLAVVVGVKHRLFSTVPGDSLVNENEPESIAPLQLPLLNEEEGEGFSTKPEKLPVLAFLVFWAVTSLVAYTLAGEKMPWLTVHISLPLLLCAGFGFGYLVDSLPFKKLANKKGLLILVLLPIFLVSLGAVITSLAGTNKPFAGNELEQLKTTSTFLFALIATVLSGWLITKFILGWDRRVLLKLFVITFGGVLLVLTARSAFQASFINYDTGKEFLVYAHAARGPKDVLQEVEEISQRTTGGRLLKVAYIGDALYPYWWYFRHFPNKVWLQDDLTRDLLNNPVVITDDEHYSKTQAILKDNYFETKFKRLVWPMQDYFNLTWQRVWEGLTNPQMRQALFNIWLNKDYRLYAEISGNSGLTLENWQPSGNIYLFVEKDIVSRIWAFGAVPVQPDLENADPYAGGYFNITPDRVFGSSGSSNGQLDMPRGLAVAPDGSIYISDSHNHRIQRFSDDGAFLTGWGIFASQDGGEAPGGTFNEPWGIAVGMDGSVYVADTWNHRIQKFTADGKFITMWGSPGLAEVPDQFWGPRGVAVDKNGLVYVTDTGNNRVVVFDAEGNYLTQFGKIGMAPGEFDEPVGIAVDANGLVYVADTWNQRIQVFKPDENLEFKVLRHWEVNAWFGQSINNKPFLALDEDDNIYITDPDAFRVLEFDQNGNYLRGWGEASSGIDGFSSPSGIGVGIDGRIWVSDSGNNFAIGFTLPELPESSIITGEPVSTTAAVPEGLVFDTENGVVVNSDGVVVYRLGADGQEWVPIIPEGIAALLPPGTEPERDAQGVWVIRSAEGVLLFNWDTLRLAWFTVSPAP